MSNTKQITSYKGKDIEQLLNTTEITKAVAIQKMPEIIELRKTLKKLEGNAKAALNVCGEYLSARCQDSGQNCLNWLSDDDKVEVKRVDRYNKVFDDKTLTDLTAEAEATKQKIKERTAILIAKGEFTEQLSSTSWSYKNL